MLKDWKHNYNKVTLDEAKQMLSGGASWFEIVPGYIGLVWPTMHLWSLDEDGELGRWESTKDYQYKHSQPDPVRDLRSSMCNMIARAKRERGKLQSQQDQVSRLEAAYRALGGDPSEVPTADQDYNE